MPFPITITNERQYRISKSQLSRLREAVEAFDLTETASRVGSDVLAKAELEALRSECEVLSEQIGEYEALKSGEVAELKPCLIPSSTTSPTARPRTAG